MPVIFVAYHTDINWFPARTVRCLWPLGAIKNVKYDRCFEHGLSAGIKAAKGIRGPDGISF